MTTEKELVFLLSKKKIALHIVGQIAFIGLFGFMANVNPTDFRMIEVKIIGIILTVVFIFVLTFTFLKLFDNSPGLIISPKGVTADSTGKISWHKIKSLHVNKSFRYGNSLTLKLHDPERYVKLSASFLDIGFDEMVNLVKQYHKEYSHG